MVAKSKSKSKGRGSRPTAEVKVQQRRSTKKGEYPCDDRSLTDAPEDFNPKKHAPLKRKKFVEDWDFFDYKTADLRRRADLYEEKAEESRRMGTGVSRKKAKRLTKMRDVMEALKKELSEQGVDVEAILNLDESEDESGDSDE